MSLFDYLQKYVDVFGENFPIFSFMTVSEEEIIKVIKDCLDKGKPYVLDVKANVHY